jgi:hypothetical protein
VCVWGVCVWGGGGADHACCTYPQSEGQNKNLATHFQEHELLCLTAGCCCPPPSPLPQRTPTSHVTSVPSAPQPLLPNPPQLLQNHHTNNPASHFLIFETGQTPASYQCPPLPLPQHDPPPSKIHPQSLCHRSASRSPTDSRNPPSQSPSHCQMVQLLLHSVSHWPVLNHFINSCTTPVPHSTPSRSATLPPPHQTHM